MLWKGILLLFLFFEQGVLAQPTLETVSTTAVAGADPTIPAVLECHIFDPDGEIDPEAKAYYSWLSPDNTLVTFNENVLVQERLQPEIQEQDGMRISRLKIDPVQLSDQGAYTCQFSSSGITLTSNEAESSPILLVNQLPELSVERDEEQVIEGSLTRIATCHGSLSKPAPEMWFEDSNGNRIDSEDAVETKDCENGLKNSTLYLTKRFTRSDNNLRYFCKVKHVNHTVYNLDVGGVNVLYSPTATLEDESLSSVGVNIIEAGEQFSAKCLATGNPPPDVVWTFTPDPMPIDPNSTKPAPPNDGSLPNNFIILEDQVTIVTNALVTTNNGTFECGASNELGSPAAVSFKLGVFVIPTTPAPTTAETPTQPLPREAGADAAVIGGVVAVAVFILIVTVILLLRYFMSHKGEYYTHELKPSDEERPVEVSDYSDDDDFPRTESDLLGEKKRTEHFL
ncbi:unnamed protein product [Clavelina lepadiformis]|uniref:Ig-like domain-containing protein n=1 Tax=Clavelina lepadiformis TaxID=159417 RepID=A0ABP0FDI8_CLALP